MSTTIQYFQGNVLVIGHFPNGLTRLKKRGQRRSQPAEVEIVVNLPRDASFSSSSSSSRPGDIQLEHYRHPLLRGEDQTIYICLSLSL